MTKLIIYDCDGVLFDTKHLYQEFLDTGLKHFGKPPTTSAQLDYCCILDEKQAFEYLVGKEHMARFEEFMEVARTCHTDEHFLRAVPMDQLQETLLFLKEQQKKLAVATNRAQSVHALLRVQGVTHFFDKVVSTQDVSKPKPDPEGLKLILQHARVSVHDALFIGDSYSDWLAANALKMRFVGFNLKGKHPTISSHKELLGHL